MERMSVPTVEESEELLRKWLSDGTKSRVVGGIERGAEDEFEYSNEVLHSRRT